jgi:hypothetical protein
MSFNYSLDLVKVLIAERQNQAAKERMAHDSRSRGGRRWSIRAPRIVGFRPSATQTCSC